MQQDRGDGARGNERCFNYQRYAALSISMYVCVNGLQQVPVWRRTDSADRLDFDSGDVVRVDTPPPIEENLLSTGGRGTHRDGGNGDEGFPSEEAATLAEKELREARQATALVVGFTGTEVSSPWLATIFHPLSEES